MGGLWIWLRAEGRRRWRAWLAVALIAGLGWGAVVAAAAGARRTDSAFPRFVEYSRAPSALVSPELTALKGFADEIARLPYVASAGPLAGVNAFVIDPKPPSDFRFGAPFLPVDGRFGRTIDRPKVIRGRLPNPESATEALVSPSFARQLRLDVGSRVTLQNAISGAPGESPTFGRKFTVTIVGIGVTQNEAFPVTVFDRVQPLLLLTPAAFRTFFETASQAFDGVAVRLRQGASIAGFQKEVERILSHHPEAGTQVFVSNELDRPSIVGRALRPQVSALAAFALVLGVTLALVIIQTITRQILTQASDHPTLRALGVTPRQLTGLAMLPAAASIVVAAIISVGVAVALSPLFPIGAARVIEPHPGFSVDVAVLAIGAAALVLVLGAATMLPARRVSRLRSAADGTQDLAAGGKRSRLADGAARTGLSAPAVAGIRMALEPGRGRTAVPVRTVLAGGFVSMAALGAAITFGANCNHAVTTPRLYGQRWDRLIDTQFETVDTASLHLESDPSYAAVAGGVYNAGLLEVGGRGVPAIGIDQVKGEIFPTLLQGHAPRAADEIVLGTTTLRRVHARVGGTVAVRKGASLVPMRVVGRAVFPAFGIGAFTPTGLGEGAALTVQGLGSDVVAPGRYSFALVRFSSHPSAEAVRRIDDACRPIDESGELCLRFTNQRPPEIESYAQVRNAPWILAGLLSALGAATLTHGLLATVRRRRRDLAILKTLGFVRRQVSGAVAWQSTTLIAFALLGLPLGVIAGRLAWIGLADQLGVLSEPRVPLATLALIIPVSIIFANFVAALPARAAASTRAALVFRTE